MRALALERNRLVKTKNLFATPEKVHELRTNLENATQEKFKEIDCARATAVDEARKKYLD